MPEAQEKVREHAVLEVKISFDPALTNAQAVADVLDALLDTALSTSGILDECGDPEAGVGGLTVQGEDED